MNQVSALPKMSSCWRMLAVTGTLFSMVHARIDAITTKGT